MKLDRSREFGTIHGGEGRACYEQDGLLFDAQGNALTSAPPSPAEEPAKRRGRPPKVSVSDITANLQESKNDIDAQIDASLNSE